MIKSPPATFGRSDPVFERLWQTPHRQRLDEYVALLRPLDERGRYLPFEELRYRWPRELDPGLCWALVKKARAAQYARLVPLGQPLQWGTFILTPVAQRTLALIDRHATSAALQAMTNNIGERTQLNYLLNDLIEDEAISSSQLEGAATTTRVAKDMLRRDRLPRTLDERMILGNYRMMKLAWEQRHQPLSVGLILQLHRVGVEGIDDQQYSPGMFRCTDDVVVQDGAGNTVHTPPPAAGLGSRLELLATWINQSHGDPLRTDYLHPLIKAIALHFALGYEHPFRDGNGRVARALFYWFMFKHDYSALRYIAISVLLRKSPVKYGRSYLYSETDGLDLTYFIDFQCTILLRAVRGFNEAYRRSLVDAEDFDRWLMASGTARQFTEQQRALFHVARNGMAKEFTTVNVMANLDCSYNMATRTLNGLVQLNVFEKKKLGREWVFFLKDNSSIAQDWLGE